MWYGFTLHMISTNVPSNLSLTSLSSGISTFIYATGELNIATSWPSYTSTTKVDISDYRDIVHYDASSLGIYPLYILPLAHVRLKILSHCFSLMGFTSLSDFCFCLGVITLGFSGTTICISSSCIYYFIMAATVRSLKCLFPCLDNICVNMKFLAILRKWWLQSWSLFSSILVNCTIQ